MKLLRRESAGEVAACSSQKVRVFSGKLYDGVSRARLCGREELYYALKRRVAKEMGVERVRETEKEHQAGSTVL